LFAQPELPLLICTGRLVSYRRLHVLLETMQRLQNVGVPVNLLLVGDGPERGVLEVQAKRDGLNLKIYGTCYDESVLARLLMAADLTVVPGRVGLTATHSLAYGTPVLVHDNPYDQGPEWESVIPGFNGAHYSHRDEADLARAVREWFHNAPPRPQLRQQCYAVVEQFYNPVSQVRRIERALDGLSADDSDWQAFRHERAKSKP
ncbi:MAG: glycosyltransferase, partial [Verrucomicrobiota bacterium]